jgi:RNA polymerase sigma-70 factor, ECF subfamily
VGDYPSDEELMTLCAGGDRGAMDVLVSRYHSRLLDFAWRHLSDREAAADIAQNTLVKAFQSARGFHSRATVKTWLYTIALNLVRDEVRRRRASHECTVSEDDLEALSAGQERTSLDRSPEEQVLAKMSGASVWRAVEGLPDNEKTAIILKFRQQLTYDEIAAVMDAPAGTVKSWVHYGLLKLRKLPELADCEV